MQCLAPNMNLALHSCYVHELLCGARMSDFPSSSVVTRVEALILQIFDVSGQEAHDHASGLAALAQDWGSPEKAAQLDWSYRVKKDLGAKLRWRSDAERKK